MLRFKHAFILLALPSLTASIALANDGTQGQTANGCSYKVINGQYFYDCEQKKPSPGALSPSAEIRNERVTNNDRITNISAAPGAIIAPGAAVTNIGPSNISAPNNNPPPTMKVVIAPPEQKIRGEEPMKSAHVVGSNESNKFLETTYLGATIGSSSITAASGSATSFGAILGTNLDDFWGVELGYSYAKQDLLLGLASRSGDSTPTPSNSFRSNKDADISSHIISVEAQYHLTDTLKRLRPYAGFGLGWKKSTLQDQSDYSGAALSSAGYLPQIGSITQNSIGVQATIGAKLRLSDTLQAAAGFHYFAPISQQSASVNYNNSGRLRQSDSAITSSSSTQISGGLQYAF